MSFSYNNSFHGAESPIVANRTRSFQEANYRINKSTYFKSKQAKNKSVKSKSVNDTYKDISDKLQKINYTNFANQQKVVKNNGFDTIFNNALGKLSMNKKYVNNAYNPNSKRATIDLNDKNYLNFKTKSGKTVPLVCNNGTFNIATGVEGVSSEDVNETKELEGFLALLQKDPSGITAKTSYNKGAIKNMLDSIGVRPGFFELKSGNVTNGFVMLDNGSIYSEKQVEDRRAYYNNTNLIKNANFSSNTMCKVDGKEYKIDKEGHFNFPKGVRCVEENMHIK